MLQESFDGLFIREINKMILSTPLSKSFLVEIDRWQFDVWKWLTVKLALANVSQKKDSLG